MIIMKIVDICQDPIILLAKKEAIWKKKKHFFLRSKFYLQLPNTRKIAK